MPGLRVVGRTSSFAFKGKTAATQEIGRALNVSHLVQGSVQQTGSRARIFATLLRAETGEQLWTDRFDTELKDIFAAQEQIAALIAKNLSLTLGATLRPAKTVNPEAHRLVLEGRHFWSLRTDSALANAEAAFRKAAEIDPTFSDAYVGLALVYVIRANYRLWGGFAEAAEILAQARAAAHRAIQLEPTSAEAYSALGYSFLLSGDFREAELNLKQALNLGPNVALTHYWQGLMLTSQGRLAEALKELELGASMDPLDPTVNSVYAGEVSRSGQFTNGSQLSERVAALTGDSFLPNRAFLARSQLALGRKDEALKSARWVLNHPELTPRWQSDFYALWIMNQLGHSEEARGHARAVTARFPERGRPEGVNPLVASGPIWIVRPIATSAATSGLTPSGRLFGWMHPAARARHSVVETLLAAVIVIRPPTEAPTPWHLRCKHCGAFALVQVDTIKRGPPTRFCFPATGPPVLRCA